MSNLLKNVTYRRKVSQNVGIEADQEYQYTETNINTIYKNMMYVWYLLNFCCRMDRLLRKF